MGQPSWLSIGAWIALVAIIVYLVLTATHKTDSETFNKGASKTEYTISENNILPRCGRMFDISPGLPVSTRISEKAGNK